MPIFPSEIQRARKAVETQVKQTDEVIASNEAIADVISGLDNTLSEVHGALSSGFSMLGAGLQELCFSIDDGFRELSYKLDLQNETLKAIKDILEKPLDTQAKELRKRGEYAYLNNWIDEAENDLLESEKKNYQDFIALHILGNIYYHHKKNNQKALEYYQKAAKYAAPQSKADACKALLCAAKVYKELGKPEDAYKSTGLAMAIPSSTKNSLKKEVEVGKIYRGMARKIMDFGAFVEIFPGTDGLVHISQLSEERVKDVKDILKEGEEVLVKVLEVDKQGKIRLSRKEALLNDGIGQAHDVNDKLSHDPQLLYNHAAYAAMIREANEAIGCLKQAVLKDYTFLVAADNDERFSNVAQEKEKLKKDLRGEQRKVVEQLREKLTALRKDFESAKDEAEEVGITDFSQYIKDLDSLDAGADEIDKLYANNSYFDLLKAERMAHDIHNEGLKTYNRNIEEWIKVKNIPLDELKAKKEFWGNRTWGWSMFEDDFGAGCFGLLLFWWIWIPFTIVALIIKWVRLNAIRNNIEKENNALARLSKLKK